MTVYVKYLNTELAKNVGGVNAAILLQHIAYWMKSSGNTSIYRTNEQMLNDIGNICSISTFQRIKKKLVNMKLITITGKGGYDRTSVYTLTKRGINFLQNIFTSVRKTRKKLSLNRSNIGTKNISSEQKRIENSKRIAAVQKQQKPHTVSEQCNNTLKTPSKRVIMTDNSTVEARLTPKMNHLLSETKDGLNELTSVITTCRNIECNNDTSSNQSNLLNNPYGWKFTKEDGYIEKHLYSKYCKMRDEYLRLSKEIVVPVQQKQGWDEAGKVREGVVKGGCPTHLLQNNPLLAKMLKKRK